MTFFTPKPLPGAELHPLLSFRFSTERPWRGPFDAGLPPNYFETDAQFVGRPEDADAIILPHNFRIISNEARQYISHWADVAENCGKPIYTFAFNDLNDGEVFDSRVKVFRLSVYRSTMREQDIVVPTTAEQFEFVPRQKSSRPVVSFCGFAGFKTPRAWLGYWVKNMQWNIKSLGSPLIRARKQGVYWRRKMIAACERSSLVKNNFIIRRSFSGALRTIELPPEKARKQFVENLRESDFVLAPKGDGNYSNRFLEALSMGRIPVLVDTDAVLPLEDLIDYSKIVVRVPMNQVHRTPELIHEFYDGLSNQEWQERQKLAHETFIKYLRQDQFFRYYFKNS